MTCRCGVCRADYIVREYIAPFVVFGMLVAAVLGSTLIVGGAQA